MIHASAPCRADLAGGTIDIWPLGMLHPGAVTVNVAILVEVRLEVTLDAKAGEVRHAVGEDGWQSLGEADAANDLTAAVAFTLCPKGGLSVRVREQAPVGSGIGGSSSYGVALARALLANNGWSMEERDLVALVRDLEARILSVHTGAQDHWAAIRGGALAVHIEPGGNRVEPLDVDHGWMADHMTVFFTGIVHHSGMVNWQVIRRRMEGDAATTEALGDIVTAAQRCREALLAQDEDAVAAAVRDEWRARKRLAPEVCPEELARLEATAMEAGASAVKGCGAGGGGSILLWHPKGAKDGVVGALEKAAPDGWVLASGVAAEGCTVRVE